MVLVRQVNSRAVGNGSAFFSAQVMCKKVVDVAGDERVICGGGGHHDHLAANQFRAPLLLVCQVIAHTEYSFLLPGEVHASLGLFFMLVSPYHRQPAARKIPTTFPQRLSFQKESARK